MDIELSEKQTIAWNYLEDQITNELLYGGGAGGGKSYLGCIWHIYRRTKYAGSRGLIGRAKIANLEQSTLVTLFKVASKMGYKSGVHFNYNSQKHTINWANGSQTILKDLFLYPSDPDFISLGSTEYTDAFIDEMPEISLKAMEIVSTRIRWMLDEFGLVPKLLGTGNPSDGFVKERFIKKNGVSIELPLHQKFVQSLVSENPDKEFKELYIKQLERLSNDYDKLRLLHGDWDAQPNAVNPFITQFNEQHHVSTDAIFQNNKPIIIIIDFNLNPFCLNFAHVWRDEKGEHCHVFDEMAVQAGSIPKIIDEVKNRYGVYLSNCFITGDAMGNRRDISQRDNATYYIQLMRGLRLSTAQMRLPANPTHENSRADCNYTFSNFPDLKFHPVKCQNTIRDIRMVQCDAFNQILKKDRKQQDQRADHLDNVRYLINSFLRQWINQHQRTVKK